jgi:hypothetical protein
MLDVGQTAIKKRLQLVRAIRVCSLVLRSYAQQSMLLPTKVSQTNHTLKRHL